jgi:hypothetical protein
MTDDLQRNLPHFIQVDDLDKSAIAGLYHSDISQYLKITKLTIQKYLEACIHEKGMFKKFFERFASFTSEFAVNEAFDRDDDKRHLQIARYFSGMREFPPQIFIQDGGYEYKPASLGSMTSGINARDRNHTQIVRVMDVVPIPIEIVCAATDEQQIEDLEAFVSAAFGQFQRFTCNYLLKPPPDRRGVYWEVRIPLSHSMSAKSHSSLHGDPKIQLWQASCSMTVDFENSTYIQYEAYPKYIPERGGIQLNAPDKVPFNKKTRFTIAQMPYPVRVYSDNSKIALIYVDKTSWVIWPKRLGTFRILVAKGATEVPADPSRTRRTGGTIVAEKEVTVVAR